MFRITISKSVLDEHASVKDANKDEIYRITPINSHSFDITEKDSEKVISCRPEKDKGVWRFFGFGDFVFDSPEEKILKIKQTGLLGSRRRIVYKDQIFVTPNFGRNFKFGDATFFIYEGDLLSKFEAMTSSKKYIKELVCVASHIWFWNRRYLPPS